MVRATNEFSTKIIFISQKLKYSEYCILNMQKTKKLYSDKITMSDLLRNAQQNIQQNLQHNLQQNLQQNLQKNIQQGMVHIL